LTYIYSSMSFGVNMVWRVNTNFHQICVRIWGLRMNNRVEYANVFLTFMSCSEMRSTLTLSDSESSSTRLMLLNSTRVEIILSLWLMT